MPFCRALGICTGIVLFIILNLASVALLATGITALADPGLVPGIGMGGAIAMIVAPPVFWTLCVIIFFCLVVGKI